MKISKQAQSTIDLFSDSGSENKQEEPRPRSKATSTPARPPRGQTGKSSGQGFLPGLSRRGRPRLANPVAPAIRAAVSRKNRIDAGAKRVELIFDAAVAAQLDALTEHFKESRIELLSRLIAKAAKKVRK